MSDSARFVAKPGRFIHPVAVADTDQWTTAAVVVLDGEVRNVHRVLAFKAVHPGMGAWSFGVRTWPEEGGRQGFVIHDRGGSVILPFAMLGDVPWLGCAINVRELVRHDRQTVPEVPRGFHVTAESSPFETAATELMDEVGIQASRHQMVDMTAVLGIPGGTCWNSTFVDVGDGNGAHHLLLEVPSGVLEPIPGRTDGARHFRRSALTLAVGTPDLKALGERVLTTEFLPFPGHRTPDQFTLSARAIFVEYMLSIGRLRFSFT